MQTIRKNDIDFTNLFKLPNQGSFGEVFTDGQTCYKMFKKCYSSERIAKKFMDMENINIPELILPNAVIINEDGGFDGYTMKYFQNSETFFHHFSSTRYVDANDILEATKRASKILRSIHSENIILCDFSFENLLINNKGEIKLCDLDSCRYKKHLSWFISTTTNLYYRSLNNVSPTFDMNLDRQSLLLSLIEELYHGLVLTMEEYDVLSDKIKTLKQIRTLFYKVLNNPNNPVPYLDEVIVDNDHYIIDRNLQVSSERARKNDYRIR